MEFNDIVTCHYCSNETNGTYIDDIATCEKCFKNGNYIYKRPKKIVSEAPKPPTTTDIFKELIGKTIANVLHDENEDSAKVVLYFTDDTSYTITSEAVYADDYWIDIEKNTDTFKRS